ncbi:MAG TPA: hypothetical protein VF316_10780 [Polyangiaceae bacterium]
MQQQPQYPYPAPQQPSYPPQGGYPAPGGYGLQAAPSGPKRNVALLVSGIIGLAIGALAFLPFAYNVYQYLTLADHFADLSAEAQDFIVPLLEHAAIHRMILFGSVSSIFGLAGLVLAGIGLQKK